MTSLPFAQKYATKSTEHAGYGLFCEARIEAGEVFATFDQYISAQRILATDDRLCEYLRGLDFEALPALNEKLILTLYLALHSAGSGTADNCEFRSAIDALPREVQNGVWTDLELSQTELSQAVQAKQRGLSQQWSALASDICDFDVWKWADSIITSRSIGLAGARVDAAWHSSFVCPTFSEASCAEMFDIGSVADIVLVPTLDLCNHAGPRRNARWDLRHPSEELILISEKAIEKGDEITISYGDDKTNTELFFNYGFSVPGNPNWSFFITLEAPESLSNVEQLDDEIETPAQYWTLCKEKYGIGPVLRFHSKDLLYFDETEGGTSKTITQIGQRDTFLALSEAQVVTILLSLDPKYLDDPTPLLEEMPETELKALGSKVLSHLKHHISQKAANLECSLDDAEFNLRTTLLREEANACRTVERELERSLASL